MTRGLLLQPLREQFVYLMHGLVLHVGARSALRPRGFGRFEARWRQSARRAYGSLAVRERFGASPVRSGSEFRKVYRDICRRVRLCAFSPPAPSPCPSRACLLGQTFMLTKELFSPVIISSADVSRLDHSRLGMFLNAPHWRG